MSPGQAKPVLVNDSSGEILSAERRRQIEEFDALELTPEVSAALFGPELWTPVLGTYADTMRVAVTMTDVDGRQTGVCHNPQPVWLAVRDGKSDAGGCSFCLGAGSSSCNAAKEALRTGQVTMARDAAGLAHVAVPLLFGNRQLGALLAGQVFDRYPEPLLLRRLARELGLSDQGLWRLAVKQTPVSAVTLSMYGKLLKVLGEAFVQQRYASLLARSLQDRTDSLVESNEALTRSNENLREFAYAASHDLQEPLRMVSLHGQLLQRGYRETLDAKANEFIDGMIEAAKRMTMLVSDLLTYTRTANEFESPTTAVEANLALETVLSILADAVREHDAVVTHGDLPSVRVLYVHLQQLFQNLVSNSLKYRNPEGPPRIHISAAQSGDKWVFSVADNGIGIDPRYAVHVFGIFKRLHTKQKYTGTGIGLAVCKKIVESYKGRIWVESELGKGSIFRFDLPA